VSFPCGASQLLASSPPRWLRQHRHSHCLPAATARWVGFRLDCIATITLAAGVLLAMAIREKVRTAPCGAAGLRACLYARTLLG